MNTVMTITTSKTNPDLWALMNFAGCIFVDSKFYPTTMEMVSEWRLPDLTPPTCEWCNRQINTTIESIDSFGWCANCYDEFDLIECPSCRGVGEIISRWYPDILEVECETCQGTGQIENDEYLAIKRANEKHRERLNHWLS